MPPGSVGSQGDRPFVPLRVTVRIKIDAAAVMPVEEQRLAVDHEVQISRTDQLAAQIGSALRDEDAVRGRWDSGERPACGRAKGGSTSCRRSTG